jgi:REP element-mobilizing transposase RayT
MRSVKQLQTTHRNLPHWQVPGATYFITWRTSRGVVLEPSERSVALDAVRFWDGKRWHVCAAVVMPDHVHVLACPLPVATTDPTAVHDLATILHSVKGFSAQQINTTRGREGAVWQDERHDRLIRDARELEERWGFLVYNPVKAGLAASPEEYPWLYSAGRADL